VVVEDGAILGVVPKSYIPTYGEFYEKRHFTPANEGLLSSLRSMASPIRFGQTPSFVDETYLPLKIGVEICEDFGSQIPPRPLRLSPERQ
jgi:NAD+ synthase (glutamine-hydrolysing)